MGGLLWHGKIKTIFMMFLTKTRLMYGTVDIDVTPDTLLRMGRISKRLILLPIWQVFLSVKMAMIYIYHVKPI